MLKYMRIPSTAGTRDPERSRFFHNLSAFVSDTGPAHAPKRLAGSRAADSITAPSGTLGSRATDRLDHGRPLSQPCAPAVGKA